MKIKNEYAEAAWVFGSRAFGILLVIVACFILVPKFSWGGLMAAATAMALIVACVVAAYLAYRSCLNIVRQRRRTKAGDVKLDIHIPNPLKKFHEGGSIPTPTHEFRLLSEDGNNPSIWTPCSAERAKFLEGDEKFVVRKIEDPYKPIGDKLFRPGENSVSVSGSHIIVIIVDGKSISLGHGKRCL